MARVKRIRTVSFEEVWDLPRMDEGSAEQFLATSGVEEFSRYVDGYGRAVSERRTPNPELDTIYILTTDSKEN